MSLFFNFKANFNQPKTVACDSVWHPEFPLLAVSSEGGQVYIFNDEGDPEDASLSRADEQPAVVATKLAWHPTLKLLVIGWSDGSVKWWKEGNPNLLEADIAHERAPIVAAEWSADGNVLATADESGLIVIWRIDPRGRLGSRAKNRVNGLPTSLCFLDKPRITAQAAPPPDTAGAIDRTEADLDMDGGGGLADAGDPLLRGLILSQDCVLVVGTGDGRIVIVDDLNHRETLLPASAVSGSAIVQILWYPDRCQIVFATAGLLLGRYQVTKTFYLSKVSLFRLATGAAQGAARAGDDAAAPLQMLWAGRSLLCVSAGDSALRLFHLEKDVNYSLSVADQDDDVIARSRAASERMSCVSFNARKLVLACGTREGRIVFWQYVGPTVEPSPADWEAFAEIDLEQPIESVTWGPGESLLAARMHDCVNLLHETVLRRKLSGLLALVQMSPEMVTVEHLLTHQSHAVKTGLRIRGLDLYGNMFACYNEKSVEIYEIKEMGEQLQVELFRASPAASAHALALHREGIFLAKRDRVELYTLAFHRRQALSFTDKEGPPRLLEVSGDFVAVATANAHVMVWHIGTGGTCRPVRTVSLEDVANPQAIAAALALAPAGGAAGAAGTAGGSGGAAGKGGSVVGASASVDRAVASVEKARAAAAAAATAPTGAPGAIVPPPAGGVVVAPGAAAARPSAVAFAAAAAGGATAPVGISITSVKLNCDGSRLSALVRLTVGGVAQPDTTLFVFNMETGARHEHDFGLTQRYVISHSWDETEPRLLGVETRKFGTGGEAAAAVPGDDMDDGGSTRTEVTTLFAAPNGLVVSDTFNLRRDLTALIGVAVPDMYFYARFKAGHDGGPSDSHVQARRMRDFEGVEVSDPQVWKGLLDFSYSLACNDGDEARKALRNVKDDAPWHNMAVMCMKATRLDVADICIARLQDALAARALREVREEEPGDVDVHNACLAIHLGRELDAERIYRRTRRHDLLVRLFMACGRWDQALEYASRLDRIHLRSVHYLHARFLEGCAAIEAARVQYELADCHRYEVPRMLFDLNRVSELESYIQQRNDPVLVRWWAQWCERNRYFDNALECYHLAEDVLSCVRMYCFLNTPDKAAELVRRSGHSAGAFLLAKQYEDLGQLEDALQYYTTAKAYRRAIRLAKDMERGNEVMKLALQCSRKNVLLDAATYFKTKKQNDKAVILYQKGGEVLLAVQLCVEGKLWNELQEIADDLSVETTDPGVFARLGEVFAEEGKYAYAARMFVYGKAYEKALRVYAEHEVPLTEEIAEQFVLPPEAPLEQKNTLLLNIARVAKHQRSYHLACRKYTQAGEKLRAAKALLESGDTKDIIFFATHSRSQEVFILSANYLQTREWQTDPEVAKGIVAFYTKAKAYTSLAAFYEAVASYEVLENRSYDRALKALKEAHKTLSKMKPEPTQEMEMLAAKAEPVNAFCSARKNIKTDPVKAVRICEEFMGGGLSREVEHILRVGDVFAFMAEFHLSKGETREAFALLRKMQDAKGLKPEDYVDHKVLRSIYVANGVDALNEAAVTHMKYDGELHDDAEVDED